LNRKQAQEDNLEAKSHTGDISVMALGPTPFDDHLINGPELDEMRDAELFFSDLIQDESIVSFRKQRNSHKSIGFQVGD